MTAPHPEVVAILGPLRPHLGAALRAQPPGDEYALVVIAKGRDPAPIVEVLGEGVTLRDVDGHQLAAVPLARARAAAEAFTFGQAEVFEERLEPGQTWCLLFGPAARAAATVITWPATSPTGHRLRGGN